ncbi:MAG TPA: hypothetical protein VN651_05210 [Gemmatimonadaceae bacterium]|nr:hypothetical protein [Gemmatimonadaceae bacterium]
MYDATLDTRTSGAPRAGRLWLRLLRKGVSAGVAALVLSAAAGAQMPGAPILQDAWATAGLVGAVNVGGGSGSVYAGAVSWTPGAGRFELSGGLGFQSRTGLSSHTVYGIRAAIPFGGASSTFGFAAFAGIGGGSGRRSTSADSAANTAEIPVGAAIGWRHALGASHGLSVFASPAFVFFTGGAKSGGLFRSGLGADFGITPSLGVTAGVDFGGSRARAVGGPSGVLYGVGLSYAFGRR